MDNLLAVALFAISSSITPGPNNVLVLTSGVNFGVRRSMPLLIGISVGFATMLLLVGFGFGQLFVLFPSLQLFIKCVGVVYLVYLAWLIAKSNTDMQSITRAKPLTFMNGALFQWVNGKAWVVASGAIVAFTNAGDAYLSQNVLIALVFLVIAFPCVGVWLIFGTLLKKTLQTQKHRRCFNYIMATLLLASVLSVCGELVHDMWTAIEHL